MKKTGVIKRFVYGFAVLGLGLFASCKDSSQVKTSETIETEAETAPGSVEEQETVQVNPAHGLPGHQCGIPVGAPLNTDRTPNEVAPPNTPAATVSPVRIDQSPKVNPPHGEPGHDCAVPVGAELKKQE